MRTRVLVRVVALGLCGLTVVAVQAIPLPAQATAKKRHCRSGQLPLRGSFHKGKLKVVAGGGAPIIGCLKRPPRGLAARYRGHARLLSNPKFVARPLRRAERGLLRRDHRLGRTLRRSKRLGDRAALAELRNPSLLARAARRTRSGPLPSYSEGGVTATGTGIVIEPDDDEVGSGGEADYTIKGNDGRVETTLRNLDRKAAFAKRCPDADGKVQGDMEFRKLRGKSEVFAGHRRVQSIDERITAKFVGHVNDDAELVDFDIEGEYVIEAKGHEEIAATGKLLYHAPTRVLRGRFAVRGQGGGKIGPSNLSGNAVGPNGWIGGEALANLWLWATTEASFEADDALDLAEEYWRTTFDKITNEEGGQCVRLEFTPSPLRIVAGDTKPIEARVVSKVDGADVAAKHKLGDYGPRGYSNYPPEGSTSPQSATSGPGSPAIFNHTAPDGMDSWATFNDMATSKRGIAVATHFAERLPPVPIAFVGTISGYNHQSGGGATENEDWTGTGLRFDRNPGSPDSSPGYTLTQGTVNWSYSYNSPATGCTASGAATFNAIGGTSAAGISFSGQTKYHGAADYARDGTYTLTCPGGYTATGSKQAFAEWWNSNGNQGYFNDVGPNWKLQGAADDSTGTIHYEWSLDPVF
jgi:hypothetical protein